MRQSTFLLVLPGPETLGVRFAVFMLGIALTGLVLLVLTVLDMAGLATVDLKQTFAWVVLASCSVLLMMTYGLWRLIRRDVLRPLEQISEDAEEEQPGLRDLDEVADTMRELRETIHRTRAELDESARNLRHVERLALVGRLAAGVAHSVRNPLTSVKLRLFSLERSLTLNSEQQEDFTVIADALSHVDGIVSNFLTFSRRPKLAPELVSLSEIIDSSLRLIESRLAAFSVTLTVSRKEQLPPVLADPEQMREAMLNILLNACEAMDYSGELKIEEVLLDGEKGRIFAGVCITDSGPGIAESHIDDIFTPFFSTKEQGTGLGLPIAMGILEEHGGSITVQNSTRGAAFILRLPVAADGGPVFLRRRALKKPRPDIAAPE